MRKYYIAMAMLGVVIAITVAVGFTLAGSPVSQRVISYDQTRYNDFEQLKYRVEEYYRVNARLPGSLAEMSLGAYIKTSDPETGNQYEYKNDGNSSYSFCTRFSTSPDEFKRYGQPIYDTPIQHTRGYSCVNYTISNSLIRDSMPVKP